ncbi:DUF2927 domain-containing protein [Aureimonas fodinaquatilis]|uniref:DUF2927 domain-containing protein n=1 Tax=Aureimonas fodinaquatilis TaxID=2565783 RepID=A0A5B0DZA7_9HYPH|nr:DUF2927 domain-containing protein [Aureimonas fodinaquatilis]KAA0971873.1 DUF2927 domain-containing protein [Aureimonas fodinaquatilis]
MKACLLMRLSLLPALAFAFLVPLAPSASANSPDSQIITGFERVAFGAEMTGRFSNAAYIKKYVKPVRFRIEQSSAIDRSSAVAAFIARINREIPNLQAVIARPGERANFIVHVVDEKDYQRVGRKVYRAPFMTVPGNCVVRAHFSRSGIERSEAVIVSDRGERLFERCLIEEILQGLGPLNENPDAPQSVFNDNSRHSELTDYDRRLMIMLYDTRLKPGMSLEKARPLLPAIARDARNR